MCSKNPETGKDLRFRNQVALGIPKMERLRATRPKRGELGRGQLFLQGFLGRTRTSEFHPRAKGNLVEDFRQSRDYLVSGSVLEFNRAPLGRILRGETRAGAGSGRAPSNEVA